jgi:hypothetical protein
MPAPIAPFLGWIVGLTFAWAASEPSTRAHATPGRTILVVILFSLLVYAPICSYFLAFAPDWSYAYLIDSERLPSAVDLGLVLVNAASVPVGFLLGARHVKGGALSSLTRLGFAPGAVTLLFLAVTIKRLGVEASYAQYHGDFGIQPLAGSPLGYAVLWMFAVLTGAVAWTSHCLRKLSGSDQG